MEKYISHLLEKGCDAKEISAKLSRKYRVDEFLMFEMVEFIINNQEKVAEMMVSLENNGEQTIKI